MGAVEYKTKSYLKPKLEMSPLLSKTRPCVRILSAACFTSCKPLSTRVSTSWSMLSGRKHSTSTMKTIWSIFDYCDWWPVMANPIFTILFL